MLTPTQNKRLQEHIGRLEAQIEAQDSDKKLLALAFMWVAADAIGGEDGDAHLANEIYEYINAKIK